MMFQKCLQCLHLSIFVGLDPHINNVTHIREGFKKNNYEYICENECQNKSCQHQNPCNYDILLREAFQTKKWGNFGLGPKW